MSLAQNEMRSGHLLSIHRRVDSLSKSYVAILLLCKFSGNLREPLFGDFRIVL